MKPITKFAALAAAAVLCFMTAKTLSITLPRRPDKISTAEGVNYLTKLSTVSAADAEKALRAAREAYSRTDVDGTETQTPPEAQTETETDTETETEAEDEPEKKADSEVPPADTANYTEKQREILEAIDEGNFDYAFRDILIVGDSLVKGLEEFDVLDSSYVIAEIGASTYYLEEVLYDIESVNPRYLVIHIGENEIDDPSLAGAFIERYRDSIEYLQENLPDTKIFVESIFPVLDYALEDEPYLENLDYYNERIREMADEMGVTYVDYDPVFASFERSYYEVDGIHQLPDFYTEQYMPHVLKEVYFGD